MRVSNQPNMGKPRPKFRIRQLVMFTKSMQICRVVAKHPADGTYTVERCDTGKRMVATEDGLAEL